MAALSALQPFNPSMPELQLLAQSGRLQFGFLSAVVSDAKMYRTYQ
jgi:hypothetical protein